MKCDFVSCRGMCTNVTFSSLVSVRIAVILVFIRRLPLDFDGSRHLYLHIHAWTRDFDYFRFQNGSLNKSFEYGLGTRLVQNEGIRLQALDLQHICPENAPEIWLATN